MSWRRGSSAKIVTFSQMELTCIAYYSQDENMINAFKEGKDMHRFTAAMAFNKPYDEVTSEERRSAKGINFGIVYQQGLATLAMNTTGGDIEAAQKLMDQFYGAFPKIKVWMDEKVKEAETRGYVTQALGGIIPIDMNKAGGGGVRNSINSPVQNLGSMIAGTFMYFFTEELEKAGIKTAPYGFVHDAYDDSIPVDYLIEYLNIQKKVMQWGIRESIGVPVSLDQEIGPNALYYMGLKILSAEGDTIRIKLEGDAEGLEDIIRKLNLSTTYTVQNIEVLESSEKTHSFEELFTVGKALKHEWGRTIKEQTIELDLVYHSGVHPDVSYLTRK